MAGWQDAPVVGASAPAGWQSAPVVGGSTAKATPEPGLEQVNPLNPLGPMQAINKLITDFAYSAGGKVTDVTGSPKAGFATNVAIETIPALLGGVGAGKAAGPGMEKAGEWMMGTALKPGVKDWQTGRATTAIKTMLDEGISATNSGVKQLSEKIKNIKDAVQSRLQSNPATVDKDSIANYVQDAITKMEKINPTPQEARAAMEKVYNDFTSNGLIPKNIPLAWANELKQGIYKAVGEKYKTLMPDADKITAQKALARGFKEMIEAAEPAAKEMNALEGRLIDAFKVAQRRAQMQGNNNPGGLALLTHTPEQFLTFMADKSALVKSLVARALYSGAEVIPAAAVGGGIAAGNSLPP